MLISEYRSEQNKWIQPVDNRQRHTGFFIPVCGRRAPSRRLPGDFLCCFLLSFWLCRFTCLLLYHVKRIGCERYRWSVLRIFRRLQGMPGTCVRSHWYRRVDVEWFQSRWSATAHIQTFIHICAYYIHRPNRGQPSKQAWQRVKSQNTTCVWHPTKTISNVCISRNCTLVSIVYWKKKKNRPKVEHQQVITNWLESTQCVAKMMVCRFFCFLCS